MEQFKGFVFGLYNVEPYLHKNECSKLFNNLTITPEFLEKVILSIQNQGFTFVSMEQFLKDKQDDKIHKNAVITIDDGWSGIYKYAFPIFKKYNIPFVFYIATDLINNGFLHCKLPEMDGMNILCDFIYKNEKNIERQQQLFEKLWIKYKHKKRLFFWKDGHDIIQSFFKEKIDFEQYKNESCCSINTIKEMVNSGLCEIGSHTHNHISMKRINEKNMIKQVIESNKNIYNFINKKCEYFSYPYGHYNKLSQDIIKNNYESATIVSSLNNKYAIYSGSDIYAIPRRFIDTNSNTENLLSI